METRPVVPNRKLLDRLAVIREEARNMMGRYTWWEIWYDCGFSTLPESEVTIVSITPCLWIIVSNIAIWLAAFSLKQVNFLTKLVALKPGKMVQHMIQNVMQGTDDLSNGEDYSTQGGRRQSGLNGRVKHDQLAHFLFNKKFLLVQ